MAGWPLQYGPPSGISGRVCADTARRSAEDRVVFVTGGAGTICSMQTRALVRLGANACIIGRSVEKTETVAQDIATVRPGAKVIGIGGCDVRKVCARLAARVSINY